jgi:Flp pilus assembly protein TadD
LLRAQTLQVAGKYREAITAFREALAAGAVAGDVQQGIALCHQRLGEKAPARSAYQQAIVAFEAQVRGGRRVEQAQRGISVCRAALDVLGS